MAWMEHMECVLDTQVDLDEYQNVKKMSPVCLFFVFHIIFVL